MTVSDFQLLKVVGKGSFGKVMQVKKKDTGAIYAMKVLKKDHLIKRKQVAHTKTERKVLASIDHPFVVSLRFAFQTETKLYMILDYFTGGELFFHLKAQQRFSEELARFYAAEIALALDCLHRNNIVYRDLKPENVLLDNEGHIRLTDFGLSKDSVSRSQLTHTFCGTPEYLAPEVIQGEGYGQGVDWWSLGTLLFEMLTGLPPFFNSNLHVMYEKILRAKLVFPTSVPLSADAKSFLQALLERSPSKRLGAGGVDEIKRHPFFRGLNWDALLAKTLVPPFRPKTVDGAEDVTNVDEEFKNEEAKDTPCLPSTLRSKVDGSFQGFTFAGNEGSLDSPEADFQSGVLDDSGSILGS
jgi:serum/glucocorticoid-regulated kinase 2